MGWRRGEARIAASSRGLLAGRRRAVAVKPPHGGSCAALRSLRDDCAGAPRRQAAVIVAERSRPSAASLSNNHSRNTPDPRLSGQPSPRATAPAAPRLWRGEVDGEHGSGKRPISRLRSVRNWDSMAGYKTLLEHTIKNFHIVLGILESFAVERIGAPSATSLNPRAKWRLAH